MLIITFFIVIAIIAIASLISEARSSVQHSANYAEIQRLQVENHLRQMRAIYFSRL